MAPGHSFLVDLVESMALICVMDAAGALADDDALPRTGCLTVARLQTRSEATVRRPAQAASRVRATTRASLGGTNRAANSTFERPSRSAGLGPVSG